MVTLKRFSGRTRCRSRELGLEIKVKVKRACKATVEHVYKVSRCSRTRFGFFLLAQSDFYFI